jgi:hypothetical protein
VPECGGEAKLRAAAAGMAANPNCVVLRIRINLRPPFPVGKPNRISTKSDFSFLFSAFPWFQVSVPSGMGPRGFGGVQWNLIIRIHLLSFSWLPVSVRIHRSPQVAGR